jgi:hypothetical protein
MASTGAAIALGAPDLFGISLKPFAIHLTLLAAAFDPDPLVQSIMQRFPPQFNNPWSLLLRDNFQQDGSSAPVVDWSARIRAQTPGVFLGT